MTILLTIAMYFGLLLLIARKTGARHADNDAFFRGNRQSPWYVVSFGMIGASLSGVTFVSVPGMVRGIDMTYMQTCIGFFFGYIIIAHVLLPLYYKLNLTSIYSYLGSRFGNCSYKTGAAFFLLSKMLGAAARLYLVCLILQHYVFDAYGVPFAVTAVGTVVLIWLYTRRSGIRTIVWTDSLQTFCLFAALVLILYKVVTMLGMDLGEAANAVAGSDYSSIFVFDDWQSKQNFFKQFLSGIFITIVMTGLDQDMMQKNLSCRNLKEAQKNMYCYGISFVPANFLFLSLGILLVLAAGQMGISLPEKGDDILPMFAAEGYLGPTVLVFFTIGIIAAAFSSADSALAALTTSFCIDILGIEDSRVTVSDGTLRAGTRPAPTGIAGLRNDSGRAGARPAPTRVCAVLDRQWSDGGGAPSLQGVEDSGSTVVASESTRRWVHFLISTVFVLCILAFEAIGSQSVIDTIYVLASYTYGPLLGLFCFGLFTKIRPRDCLVPYVAIASPVVCWVTDYVVSSLTGYRFGYEMLMVNGGLTFLGLYICRGGSHTCPK